MERDLPDIDRAYDRRTVLTSGAAGLVLLTVAPGSAMGENSEPVLLGEPVTLYAGQDVDIGTVVANGDDTEIDVTYETDDDWVITDTHLHVGDVVDDLPTNPSGNPPPGWFEYSGKPDTPGTVVDYQGIDVGELDDPIVVAAHAEVEGSADQESAWADGDPISDNGNWATYFELSLAASAASKLSNLDIAEQGSEAEIHPRETGEMDITVDVENVGEAPGSFEVFLELTNDEGAQAVEMERETGTLDPGDVEDVPFENVEDHVTSDYDEEDFGPGTSPFGVRVWTDDDEIVGEFVVAGGKPNGNGGSAGGGPPE